MPCVHPHGASSSSQLASLTSQLCQVRMLRPGGDLLGHNWGSGAQCSWKHRVLREPLGTWGAAKTWVGEGGAENPFPFCHQPRMVPRSSLRLPFLQKQRAVPCQGSPTCGVGEAGLAPKTGAHGRRAGTAREPPDRPHFVPQRRQQMVDWLPTLQKPLCSGPARPSLPPSPAM